MAYIANLILEPTPTAAPRYGDPTKVGLGAIVEPVGAIGFNAAAALRWLDRDQPEIQEAIACLNRVVDGARQVADVVRPAP